MITVKCPVRISLIGGSSDLDSYIEKHKKGSVISFTPQIYTDNRGYFLESYNNSLQETLNISFPQENHSRSKKYVFRGVSNINN